MTIKFKYNTNADTSHKSFQEDFLISMGQKFKAIISEPKIGFFNITNEKKYLTATKEMVAKFKNKKHFVQIGIGGSALGPQMLVSALRKNWDISFSLLDNTDSDYISDELNKIDPKNALFYIVSKSGGTAETIASYVIVRKILIEKGIQEKDFSNYFVFCTDPTSGQLREHVNKNNYNCLEVPSNIGGRYSVLSSVGLFPALFMGIDIDELYNGANEIKENILNDNMSENNLLKCAAHVAYLFTESSPKVDETVLMPYSSKLKDFSFWFVQLWAESLGKYSEEKKEHTGLTPVPAYGATDQHSQMQLFMEGPNNKCMFLLNIENKNHDFSLDSDLEFDSACKLKPYTMNQLIEAEFQGSLTALKENNRNIIALSIDSLNERSLGALILFFESLTALMGEYLLVDPFNQPGVEKGKKYAFEYLNSLRK